MCQPSRSCPPPHGKTGLAYLRPLEQAWKQADTCQGYILGRRLGRRTRQLEEHRRDIISAFEREISANYASRKRHAKNQP